MNARDLRVHRADRTAVQNIRQHRATPVLHTGNPTRVRSAGTKVGSVAIIGTRGYPSFYGGFETLLRKLAQIGRAHV